MSRPSSALASSLLALCLGPTALLSACGADDAPQDARDTADLADTRDTRDAPGPGGDSDLPDTADLPDGDTDTTTTDTTVSDTSDTTSPDTTVSDTLISDTLTTDTPITDTPITDTTVTFIPPQTTCGATTFRFDPPGTPSQVLLTGSFAGWAGTTPGALAMTAGPGGVFSTTVTLAPGPHQFKYIADGTWMFDPDKAQVDDGFSGSNNQLTVGPCVPLQLTEYTVRASSFEARFTSRTTPIAASAVTVTKNLVAAPAGTVTTDGDDLVVAMSDLTTGIHDVRLTHAGHTLLLKVYIGVSTDWRDVLLYFVMTDRFADGKPANNNPVPDVDERVNWKGGDFVGVTQKIEAGYFDELGVNALWLSWPIEQAAGMHEGSRPANHQCGQSSNTTAQTPSRFTAFHGYWPSKLDRIEPRYGTLEELQALVHAAHARGIRIVLDFTANHVHESAPIYQQHKDSGWFNQPAEVCEVVGWDNKPKTCWFTSYLPDVDYRHPDLRQFMLDHAVDIALKTGADGFRLDAVKHIEPGLLPDLRQRLADAVELTGVPFYLVGETFTGDAAQIDSFVGPDRLHGQFDFPANYKILQALARADLGLNTMDADIRGLRTAYKGGGPLMSTFIGNHDMGRFISMAAGDMFCGVWDLYADLAQGWLYPPPQPTAELPYKKLALAFAYAMTIPGVPLIYYGDEFGLAGANDPDNRRMMRFGAALSARESTALSAVAALGRARSSHPSLSRGAWPAPLLSETDLLVYARTLPNEKAIVLLNRSTSTRTVTVPLSSLGLPQNATFTDALGTGTLTANGSILVVEVPATSPRILIYTAP